MTAPPRPEQIDGLTWSGVGKIVDKLTTVAQRRRFRALVATLMVVMAGLWTATAEPGCWKPEQKPPALEKPPVGTLVKDDGAALRFSIREGAIANHFYRHGPVAAHVLLRSGDTPRVLVAFPAGNSGAGIWFEAPGATLELEGELAPIEDRGGYGVSATVVARGVDRLRVRKAVLGSVRVLRDYNRDRTLPEGFDQQRTLDGALEISRRSADGDNTYRLRLEPLAATVLEDGAALSGKEIRFRVTATTDEPPLTPIPMDELLGPGAGADRRARQALAFLSYEEKLLAGSWRFLTYFGRDTLLSTRLLMPALTERAIEAALGSVIERLSPTGAVAHEEDIGEFPGFHGKEAPAYDYKMVDDDFMLAPVLAAYLFERRGNHDRAALLKRKTAGGERYANAVARNLAYVLDRARPYAERPGVDTLIALKEGMNVGEWRDSEMGLGGGRIAYNVNAALVPAALRAAALLYRHPAINDAERADDAERLAKAWAGVGERFRVEIPRAKAEARLRAYAEEIGVPIEPALESLVDEPVTFPALALDGAGKPLPILHSDDGFVLVFGEPDREALRDIADRIVRPFPAGLRTPVGIVVANPAYAPAKALRDQFTREHYHGTVIWSWQQALMASGLERQLARRDLDVPTREVLTRARKALWEAIEGGGELRSSELWSWAVEDGRWKVVPFGQGSGHHAESNAAQLWSTVYLALEPPR
jgi:hypothetical protein